MVRMFTDMVVILVREQKKEKGVYENSGRGGATPVKRRLSTEKILKNIFFKQSHFYYYINYKALN